ncbi:hypothetical protein [Streptomyces sp. NPDC006285]|uniref:hypothetical protein n=1 Tax=Streptomyces sp. NPDC006285 TaxID=3364742 RepID=UPI003699ED8B
MQITIVSHTFTGTDPADPVHTADPADRADPAAFTLALVVAHELHAPASRAPEVAAAPAPRGTARRGAAARTRRTVRG